METLILTASKWRDYLELCKPKVVLLMLITTIIGMQLATPAWVPLNIFIFGTLGIALCAFAAAVFNHLADQRIDAVMLRTRDRPLPQGRVSTREALIFAVILAAAGMIILITFVNVLTALLTLFTLIGYAGIYTLYLKRATPQNIVIGGVAGAAPPLLGWTAVTGHIEAQGLLLMLIIFIWTPPHFWALAIARQNDYAQAKIPMLPVTHGVQFTKLNILLYTLLLFAVTLLPYATELSGTFYLIGALILNSIFLFYAIKLWCTDSTRLAMQTFRYSILYLFLLFVILLIDHYLP